MTPTFDLSLGAQAFHLCQQDEALPCAQWTSGNLMHPKINNTSIFIYNIFPLYLYWHQWHSVSGQPPVEIWQSDNFAFECGVFQGWYLSPTMFIIIFNPVPEYLMSEQKHRHYLNTKTPGIRTPFAADFNVITTNPSIHQCILSNVEQFANHYQLINIFRIIQS